ncbi:hypothetical protein TorRG33x02_082060 [Trema orientale]|uniref:Uncharacterized protein n=1 Tax=Trema orientale TaxID=63057 RepID=A0A2P5FDV1_TREOI|nr:hypothetical protein TorRG33x02_082060 [Trema orientale]
MLIVAAREVKAPPRRGVLRGVPRETKGEDWSFLGIGMIKDTKDDDKKRRQKAPLPSLPHVRLPTSSSLEQQMLLLPSLQTYCRHSTSSVPRTPFRSSSKRHLDDLRKWCYLQPHLSVVARRTGLVMRSPVVAVDIDTTNRF